MNYYKITMVLGALFVIAFAVMSVFHLPGTDTVYPVGKFVFLGLFFMLVWQNSQLKKKISMLENNRLA